jgi:CO dehydrogenase maturation factor
MFSLNPYVADLISKYSITYDDINLMVLGGVRKGGGGCACPESTLLKSLIRQCVLKNNEFVILDMEAGIEHLGRATATAVDALVIVTEAGTRSFETASHILTLAKDLCIDQKVSLLLNKTRSFDHEANKCSEMFPGVPVIGQIPFDERFIECD